MSEPYLPPEDIGANSGQRGSQETEKAAFFLRIGKLFVAGELRQTASHKHSCTSGSNMAAVLGSVYIIDVMTVRQ